MPVGSPAVAFIVSESYAVHDETEDAAWFHSGASGRALCGAWQNTQTWLIRGLLKAPGSRTQACHAGGGAVVKAMHSVSPFRMA